MNKKKHLIIAIIAGLLAVPLCLMQANEVATLKKKLPKLKGGERIEALYALYDLTYDDGNINEQSQWMNDAVSTALQLKDNDTKATAIAQRAVHFYNNNLSDSIYKYVPNDLNVLRSIEKWSTYYEVWTHLVNTYTFSGNTATALREVQKMFDDAKNRNNAYGMGMAYYTMGNVYTNMNNLGESANAYQHGLDLLMEIKPKPPVIADICSYYSETLLEQKQYEKMEKLNVLWEKFLKQYIVEHNLQGQPDEKILWSYYYLASAQTALGLGQLNRAEQMLNEAHKRIASDEDYVGLSWLQQMTQLRLQQGKLQEALQMSTRRLEMMNSTGEESLYITLLQQRAQILSKMGRHEEAAKLYLKMYQLNDSINTQGIRKQLNEMNTLFQVDELKMEQERTQFRNTLIIGSIIMLALLIFAIFRYIAAKRLKQAHKELLVAYDQLEETTTAKERIESDLRIARDIQMSMVPSTFPEREDLDLHASMTPAKEVGGDLYGYHLVDNQLYFCLGDVSGKGVPASLFMAQATRLFRTLAAQRMMPAEIATRINDALSGDDNERGMFVTMFIGLADLTTGHLHFCNAGHNPPVLLSKKWGKQQAQFIEMVPNAPIGLWPELEYEGEEIADISNQPFFVYTDGLNEAENNQQEQFTDERLLELMEQTPFISTKDTIDMLRSQVEKHRDGAEPNDDLTMLCLMIKNNAKINNLT